MNTIDIQKYLKQIDLYIENNVYAANRLPIHVHLPTYIISNLDNDNKPGSHWVAIHIDANGFGQYFDSYGRPPHGYHQMFLKRNSKMWNYNINRIQNDYTSVCGSYCLLYLYYKYHGRTLNEFQRLFGINTICNDMTLFSLFNQYFKANK